MENIKQYDAIQIANWFIKNLPQNTSNTPLKIQKLLYFSEAWVQVFLERELFKEQIQAWAHGPVVPEVYHALKQISTKDDNIDTSKISVATNDIHAEVVEILNSVIDLYGKYSGLVLEEMTHKDAPWIEARNGLAPEVPSQNIISKISIRRFFKNKYAEALNA